MKPMILLSAAAFLMTGCRSYVVKQAVRADHTDGSVSALTFAQACEIAKRESIARDGFVDEPRIPGKGSKLILVSTERINEGGWRAIARAAASDNLPDAGGGAAFLPVPAAVVTIDSTGKVTDYSRYSNDEITRAKRK